VQGAYAVPQTLQPSVSVSFIGAQTAGDLNVIAIGWTDSTSQVVNVTDARGNTYTPALAPTVLPGSRSHVIYYAQNIVAATTNSVTVTFNTAVTYPDVRIAEYRGISTVSALDATSGASGTGTTSSSGSVTTTSASALIIAANVVQSITTNAGTDYTSRIITAPNGNILEDRVVTTTGSYSATAPTLGGGWVMQIVAFRGAGDGTSDTQAPTAPGTPTATVISSSRIDLTWPVAIDNVGVTTYRVERCQGPGCTTFAEIGTSTTTNYSDTSLAASTNYSYRLRAADAAGNLGGYSTTASAITDSTVQTAPISYVQGAYAVPQTPQPSVSVSFTGAQAAGNLNVIAIGWTDSTSQVVSVTDARGNTYTPALAPTVLPGSRSHVIYYAQNIVAATTNSVTVTFNTAVTYPDVRIAEYRGLSTLAALDAANGASGTGTTSNSGSVTTTTASTLLVAANVVQSITMNAGAGYTSRTITSPNGNILEDSVVTATGNYSATASTGGGGWVMQIVAFRGAAGGIGDTQSPTAPGNPTATVISSSRIDLTWPAATDNVGVTSYRVERCQGPGCTTFAEIGIATTASYSDTSLAASTSYAYRVKAKDAAGNLGPYSPTVSATTSALPDTESPTAPGSPSASAVSSSQINVSWTASSDNVGVTLYLVERCQGANCTNFSEIGGSSVTNYTNTGLAALTTYRYRIRASDAAGNVSAYSAVAQATTQGPTLSINQPSNGASIAGSTVKVGYVVGGDLTGVDHVHFQLDAGPIVMDLSLDGSYQLTGVAPGSHVLNGFLVRADHSKILGTDAVPVSFSTTADTQPPSAPANVSASAVSSSQIDLTWTTSTDDASVVGYRIERCQGASCTAFAEIGIATTTSYSDTSLAASTSYSYRVRAADAAGNLSDYSPTATATTQASVNLPISYAQGAYAVPQTPQSVVNVSFPGAQTAGDLNVVAIGWTDSTSQVISVTDSRGNVYTPALMPTVQAGLQSHVIYYGQNIVGAATNTVTVTFNTAASFPDVRIAEYRGISAVTALDTANGASGGGSTSNSGPVTTTVADALIIGANVVQSFTTSAGTDFTSRVITSPNGSILEDRIVTTIGSYSATASTNGGRWVMQIVAFRGATGDITDTQPPTAPGNPAPTVISSSRIDLTWPAATDNVGVTAYRVERCQGSGCTTFAEIGIAATTNYGDSSLAASTSYSYRVRAADDAGNLGLYSPTATAITQSTVPAVPISYVQGAYAVPQTPQSVVSVSFTGAQTAGDLNVVAIGWSDSTSQVVSVTDARGNAYAPALATTAQAGVQSHVIYYAQNIVAAATNTVTVTFNTAVTYPDVRIAEYRGIRTLAALDAVNGTSGIGTTSTSGPVTTTTADTLLVAANVVQSATTSAGTGFTARMITSPNGSILEDRIVTTAGSYSATAPTSGGGWVMQIVAFRSASGGAEDTQAPTAPGTPTATVLSSSRIDLTWLAATDNLGVTAYRIERCQGSGCTAFAEIGIATTTNYGDSSLAASTSYSYRVSAADAAGNLGPYSTTVSATTLAQQPASISIYLPTDGSAVSGTATFGADVTGPIVSVQFQVDNINVGLPVSPSSTLSVNTRLFANGSHLIKAYGWDSQRNFVEAAPITVSFSNTSPGNPAQTGLWSDVVQTSLVSVNVTLMGNGRVLMYDRLDIGNPSPQVWDPITNSFLAVPLNDGTNLFCSGQVLLPDGRVFVAGGHLNNDVGLATGRVFDPDTNLWSATPNMAVGRWYPSLTVLPNGKVLVLSGEIGGPGDYARVPEVYDPGTNSWTTLPMASLSLQYYPHAFVLPNGKVGITGTAEAAVPARTLDVATQTWTTVDSRTLDAYSSAMYLPGKVLKTGTSTDSLSSKPSSANAYVIDMTASNPQWRQVQSMANPRAYHVETLLPDGSVLVTGGGRTTGDYDIPNAVYSAELWSPSTETWTTLSAMQKPRLYHGTALLLPDGRVMVSGSGRSPGPDVRDQESLEIFAPPYLFKGPRPTITTAPDVLGYNKTFNVETPNAANIAAVALLAVGNMTHGINMSQRYLPLSFSVIGGSLTVSAPNNANLAPPGIYMLFIVNAQGVPSMASFVRF